MSKLPNPKDFEGFKAELSKTIKFDKDTKYDLNKIYDSLKSNPIPSGYISKLINLQILEHNPKAKEILKDFICYSKLDDSLAIILKDSNQEVKTIAINRAKDKDKNLIKWKTYGSKKYIQYKIKDDFIFIAYGMAEILLCELFELSYIAFQSDSIVLNLQNHKQWQEDIKPKLKDKVIILLLDNDDSCRKTIKPLKEELSYENKLIPIEMEDLEVMEKAFLFGGRLKQTIPNGYDFKDYCNEIKNPQKIEEILKETIKAKYEF